MKERKNTVPFFSVIVPMYNSAAFIDKCVLSVLNQSYSDFELILVDDGSTDSTLEICKRYEKEDCRVKVIHKENGGHTSARNVGLEISRGGYILFLDSDDWYDFRTLEFCREDIECFNSEIIIFGIENNYFFCLFFSTFYLHFTLKYGKI